MGFSKDCIDIRKHVEECGGKSRIKMREGKDPLYRGIFQDIEKHFRSHIVEMTGVARGGHR